MTTLSKKLVQTSDTKTLAAFCSRRVGFIPTLAAAGNLLCILSAVGRTGINPAPTVDVCNTLVINGLPSQRLRKAGRIRPLVGLEEAKEYNYSVDRPNLCGVSLF